MVSLMYCSQHPTLLIYMLKSESLYLGIGVPVALLMYWNPCYFTYILKSTLFYSCIGMHIALLMYWNPYYSIYVLQSTLFSGRCCWAAHNINHDIARCPHDVLVDVRGRPALSYSCIETHIILSKHWNSYCSIYGSESTLARHWSATHIGLSEYWYPRWFAYVLESTLSYSCLEIHIISSKYWNPHCFMCVFVSILSCLWIGIHSIPSTIEICIV